MPPADDASKSTGEWAADQLLTDRYRVRQCVRSSGTCQLWRVADVFRQTAHLVLRPSPAITQRVGWRQWFELYCEQALSVLPHPNVLTAERMTGEGGMPFMVMECADGRCWDELITDGKLVHLPKMLDIAIQSADGLAWLHSQGRIHYNVKPANVLVCQSGVAKLWKYGEPNAMTRAYASPEQAGGKPLTEATDVWSWAASVLHMFVGKVAWREGAKAALALRRYRRNGPSRSGIALMPGALMELLATCLAEAPGERHMRMDEITERLEAIYETAIGRSYSAPAPQADASPGGGGPR